MLQFFRLSEDGRLSVQRPLTRSNLRTFTVRHIIKAKVGNEHSMLFKMSFLCRQDLYCIVETIVIVIVFFKVTVCFKHTCLV